MAVLSVCLLPWWLAVLLAARCTDAHSRTLFWPLVGIAAVAACRVALAHAASLSAEWRRKRADEEEEEAQDEEDGARSSVLVSLRRAEVWPMLPHALLFLALGYTSASLVLVRRAASNTTGKSIEDSYVRCF